LRMKVFRKAKRGQVLIALTNLVQSGPSGCENVW
jgi:hypothetical protein